MEKRPALVAVSIGDQGVLMVDSQCPEMVPKLQAEIRKLGGGDIDFTVNTHWHFDHADGNPLLGRENSWMLAEGSTLEGVIAARPTADFDRQYGKPELFLTKIYYNLTQ